MSGQVNRPCAKHPIKNPTCTTECRYYAYLPLSSASLFSASSSTNPTKPQEHQQMLGPDGPQPSGMPWHQWLVPACSDRHVVFFRIRTSAEGLRCQVWHCLSGGWETLSPVASHGKSWKYLGIWMPIAPNRPRFSGVGW